MSDVRAYSVRGFAKANSISRSQVYKEIKERRLRTFNVGKRRLISDEAGDDWRRDREREAQSLQEASEPVTLGPSNDTTQTGKGRKPL